MITAEIVSTEIEPTRSNIIIWVQFKHDDVEIPFYQGAELLEKDGKKVWPLYARYQNFIGKTAIQQADWVRINIEAQIGAVIQEITAKEAQNAECLTDLSKLMGTRIEKDSVDIKIDPNHDGQISTITLKDDGTIVI